MPASPPLASPVRRPLSVPAGKTRASSPNKSFASSTGSIGSPVRLPPFSGCSPGPLDYNIVPEPGSEAPKWTLQGRHYAPERVDLGPGPAGYQVPPTIGPFTPGKTQAPSWTLPARALSRDTASTPGPGYYEDKLHLGTDSYFAAGPAWTMLPRPTKDDGLIGPPTPGPGAYRQKEIIGNEAPKKSIAYRLTIPRGVPSPGPAAYNPKVDTLQPKWTISGRDDKPKQADWYPSPGAGEYTPNPSAVRLAAPAFSFGRAARSESQFDRMMKKKREDARKIARQQLMMREGLHSTSFESTVRA
eukprot:TRINITY_DN11431_c0_g1::TRINITY_DN11431_c0_g1_i1::g.10837::m.10837 TRINITY_DN11431_c0_g1::TRINITY_DN11431_c0_g1_i1::g.10837  ORF type:complete len:301 (-),score=10.10,sp/Q920N1/ODF3A_MOUSE/31.34/7e-07,sp/Q920N1/ODF3A_MOUSE/30.41/4e-06,SHIPPO-rpt/PF07004.7/1.5e+04,SHIPPO-rpt/PF07004.7/50,SHIPPO-rpt/PF07004.7/1.9e+03,SHIPPO-rpt/PF07004.7/0.21,SHIPPO-rpt/PF07004.7/5.6,SHIPPO-rpt/PF07004.7/0.07,SHIPPO-rpt/PF07004.7/0.45 TRINITY_DN11431_c0_g1_i1:109-1011(-)